MKRSHERIPLACGALLMACRVVTTRVFACMIECGSWPGAPTPDRRGRTPPNHERQVAQHVHINIHLGIPTNRCTACRWKSNPADVALRCTDQLASPSKPMGYLRTHPQFDSPSPLLPFDSTQIFHHHHTHTRNLSRSASNSSTRCNSLPPTTQYIWAYARRISRISNGMVSSCSSCN
jgi:hypothetical protein